VPEDGGDSLHAVPEDEDDMILRIERSISKRFTALHTKRLNSSYMTIFIVNVKSVSLIRIARAS
jgi:hypothetical protein